VVRAHDDDRAAGRDVDAEVAGPRDDVVAIGHLAPEHGGEERGLCLLGRALGRAQALDLGRDQRGHDAQQRSRRIGGPAAHAQASDDRVADAQLVRGHALGVGDQRPLVGGRPRRHREHGARAVDQDERHAQRARRCAHHLGQPGARLDGFGDLVESVEVCRRRLRPDRDRLGHHAIP
jgi:hypothetical protein